MAQNVLIWSIIGFVTLVLLGVATGTGSTQIEELNHYGGEVSKEDHRSRPDSKDQSVVVVANSGEDEDNTNMKKNRNNFEPNFGELKESNIVKRAPSGFMGMRGKKAYEISDYSSNNALGWGDEELNPTRNADDSNFSAESNSLTFGKPPNVRRLKKAPTAFYGVRGKKYGTGNADFNRLDDFLEKLEEQSLRETMLQDFIDRLALSTVAQNEIAKRAPTGFTGMRGKRPASSLYDDYDDAEMGMAAEKRASKNSFVGVRGKKDVSHQAFKRSTTSDSFNNARGGGGKNQRFVDFSNKFVAVRGKKGGGVDWSREMTSSNDVDGGGRQQQQQQQRLFVNVLPSLLFGGGDDSIGKRAPTGFVGMRGKREAAANALAVNSPDRANQ